jgi:hypothetical protein
MCESTNHPTIKAMSQPPKSTAALKCYSQAANPSAETDRRLTKGSPRSLLLEQSELPPQKEAALGQVAVLGRAGRNTAAEGRRGPANQAATRRNIYSILEHGH